MSNTRIMETTLTPSLVVFSRPTQRREIIVPYDARRPCSIRSKVAPRARAWLRHRVTLGRIAATAFAVAAVVIVEDIAGAILEAVSPPPAYQFGGIS